MILRQLRGSGLAGLAGMAAIRETASVRLLRPLLGVTPGRLRATLRARGLGWADDPTNDDGRFTRARLRTARADAAGDGPATRALSAAAAADGQARHAADRGVADWLASAVSIRPEGFALLPDGAWPPAALAALLRMITGADHLPPPKSIAGIAAAPGPAIGSGICLAGARFRPAGRLGPGFLICREAAAMEGRVPAVAGASWDGRFRRPADQSGLVSETIGPLGTETRRFRHMSDLPAVVLETIPAYYNVNGDLIAVQALMWPDPQVVLARWLLFHPRRPGIGAAFQGQSSPRDKAAMT